MSPNVSGQRAQRTETISVITHEARHCVVNTPTPARPWHPRCVATYTAPGVGGTGVSHTCHMHLHWHLHIYTVDSHTHTHTHLYINTGRVGQCGPLEASRSTVSNCHPCKPPLASQRPSEIALIRGIFAFLDSG